MKHILSLRLGGLIALAAGFAPVVASAQNTVTFGMVAGTLTNADGSVPLANGSLALLIADTDNNGFSQLLSGSSLADGSFLNAGDQIIGSTSVMDGGVVNAIFNNNITVGSGQYSTLATGDKVALVWFSGLTYGSATLTSGAQYGLFTTTLPDDGDPWLVPGGGTPETDLRFVTEPDGTYPASDGEANLTASMSAVPEPSTYSLIAGVAAIGLVGLLRLRQGRKGGLSVS